jgi:hypothetical protein
MSFGNGFGNHQWAVLNDTLRILVRKSQGHGLERSRPSTIRRVQSPKSKPYCRGLWGYPGLVDTFEGQRAWMF